MHSALAASSSSCSSKRDADPPPSSQPSTSKQPAPSSSVAATLDCDIPSTSRLRAADHLDDDGLLDNPQPGPSTSAAEFDLEVFDSGSSCSLEDCWGVTPVAEVAPRGGKAAKKTRRANAGGSGHKHKGARSSSTTSVLSDCEAIVTPTVSSTPRLPSSCCLEDEEDEEDRSVPDSAAPVAVDMVLLDEPPISACPSETEEAASDKEEDEDEEEEEDAACQCPTYLSDIILLPPSTCEDRKEVVDRWKCSAPSTSSKLLLAPGDHENIDEIVNDHDTFGTDENEDSLDSANAAEIERAARFELLLLSRREDDLMDTAESVVEAGSLLPVKRKSGSVVDGCGDDDDETGLSSMKKQCVIIAPASEEGTLEIAAENVVETSECVVCESVDCACADDNGDDLFSADRRLSDKDGSSPPREMVDWLGIFGRWSNVQKLAAIDQLIASCQPSQVRHMMAVIEPQFQRDFISLLPKELALYVLSFLCPRDLLRAAQTCRYWRILCEDNLLWREKCREAELGDFKDLMRCRVRKASSSSGSSFVYSACKTGFMRQHNIDMNWRVRPVKQVKVLKGHDDHVITCLQFSNNRIVSGSDDNTLKVWSAVTGKCLRTLVGHTGGVWSSQMEDNTIVSGSTDRTLKVWDAETGHCVHTLYGHTSTVRCMHLHKNRVVSGSRDATLRMWDIDSGECLHVLVGHVAAVRCVQYDGRLVVSGAYDYMVKVWNPEREECLHTLSGHTNRVYSLQFDGAHVVSGSLDTSIRVWDVETGACKHALMGHQSLTSGMELRNNILVSGNADSTVKVWDITTGQCLQTLSGSNKHQSAVTCLQFNSKFVITSSDDGTVKLWDVKTGEFIRDLVALDSGGSGGVVWRIRANPTKLVCAVGSRNGTEETKLLVLDFDALDGSK